MVDVKTLLSQDKRGKHRRQQPDRRGYWRQWPDRGVGEGLQVRRHDVEARRRVYDIIIQHDGNKYRTLKYCRFKTSPKSLLPSSDAFVGARSANAKRALRRAAVSRRSTDKQTKTNNNRRVTRVVSRGGGRVKNYDFASCEKTRLSDNGRGDITRASDKKHVNRTCRLPIVNGDDDRCAWDDWPPRGERARAMVYSHMTGFWATGFCGGRSVLLSPTCSAI